MLKKLTAITILIGLSACAYQPNFPPDEQARPTYQADLSNCKALMEGVKGRLWNTFGLVGTLYGYSSYSDAEIAESEQLSSFQGQHAYIDNCMKQKGYKVQQ